MPSVDDAPDERNDRRRAESHRRTDHRQKKVRTGIWIADEEGKGRKTKADDADEWQDDVYELALNGCEAGFDACKRDIGTENHRRGDERHRRILELLHLMPQSPSELGLGRGNKSRAGLIPTEHPEAA